jgi:hypothetical protein
VGYIFLIIPRDRPNLVGGPGPSGPGLSMKDRLRESAAPPKPRR